MSAQGHTIVRPRCKPWGLIVASRRGRRAPNFGQCRPPSYHKLAMSIIIMVRGRHLIHESRLLLVLVSFSFVLQGCTQSCMFHCCFLLAAPYSFLPPSISCLGVLSCPITLQSVHVISALISSPRLPSADCHAEGLGLVPCRPIKMSAKLLIPTRDLLYFLASGFGVLNRRPGHS
jgi:hypothetical protein